MTAVWEYGLFHVILVAVSYYLLGIVKGITALIFLYYGVKWISAKFGYEIWVGNDVVHMFDSEKSPHNVILILELDRLLGLLDYLYNK